MTQYTFIRCCTRATLAHYLSLFQSDIALSVMWSAICVPVYFSPCIDFYIFQIWTFGGWNSENLANFCSIFKWCFLIKHMISELLTLHGLSFGFCTIFIWVMLRRKGPVKSESSYVINLFHVSQSTETWPGSSSDRLNSIKIKIHTHHLPLNPPKLFCT